MHYQVIYNKVNEEAQWLRASQMISQMILGQIHKKQHYAIPYSTFSYEINSSIFIFLLNEPVSDRRKFK